MDLVVIPAGTSWQAKYGEHRWRCAVGRCGVHVEKVEGDGVSPVGRWPIRTVLYRSDRIEKPISPFPTQAITELDGWCDDPAHADYNRPVTRPFSASHEEMWRQDNLYDIVVVLGHNDDPPVRGAGSAIFLHIAHVDYSPTEGCAALSRGDLLAFLACAQPGTHLEFRATV
ncbi:L,D-transpeptidase family protein [Shinella sp.]|uniref:L,D-transpeptidase family protein n=1 Tax=Shinella sp. TaxID=1870904 RepID=UPI0028ACAB2B|nr:L,D-transpeptidase family protein [Shinella sp.]